MPTQTAKIRQDGLYGKGNFIGEVMRVDLEIEFHRAMQIIVLGATVVVATIPSYLYQDKLMIALTFVLIFGTIIVAQIAGVNDYKRTLKATV